MTTPSPRMLRGEVVRGDGRGRMLGFPTANLQCDARTLPDDGIYAAWVRVDDDPTPRAGTVSVGTNPTFVGERERRVEVHLHAADVDLYGRSLAVELVAFLRPTICFIDADALIAQSIVDIADSEAVLAAG